MSSRIPNILVLCSDGITTSQRWALGELLARVGLPYRYITNVAPESNSQHELVMGIGVPLPEWVWGIELPCSGQMKIVRLAEDLANDHYPARRINRHYEVTVPFDEVFSFCLGRTEELSASNFDHHGRVCRSCLSLEQTKHCHQAIVEQFATGIFELLEQLSRSSGLAISERKFPWPDCKTWAVHLSHDVDYIDGRTGIWKMYLGWICLGLKHSLMNTGKAKRYWGKLHRWLSMSGDPQYTIPSILDLEALYEMTSSFYFLVSSRRRLFGEAFTHGLYTINHPRVKHAIDLIVQAGSEVGLHGRYHHYVNTIQFVRQKKLLEVLTKKKVSGVRQHYLRLKVPETWRAQDCAGFEYDATLGWREGIGPRAYTVRPFRIWDAVAQESLDMYELPLSVMDASLNGLGVQMDKWWIETEKQLKIVQEFGGVAGILLHPRCFDDEAFPGCKSFWRQLLEYIRDHNGWGASGSEIVQSEKVFRGNLCLS